MPSKRKPAEVAPPPKEPIAPTTVAPPGTPVEVIANPAPSWKPTRKWLASTFGALGSVLLMWATTGSWDQEETVSSITLGFAAIGAYLLPNDK